jgi:hypothetical protein
MRGKTYKKKNTWSDPELKKRGPAAPYMQAFIILQVPGNLGLDPSG